MNWLSHVFGWMDLHVTYVGLMGYGLSLLLLCGKGELMAISIAGIVFTTVALEAMTATRAFDRPKRRHWCRMLSANQVQILGMLAITLLILNLVAL